MRLAERARTGTDSNKKTPQFGAGGNLCQPPSPDNPGQSGEWSQRHRQRLAVRAGRMARIPLIVSFIRTSRNASQNGPRSEEMLDGIQHSFLHPIPLRTTAPQKICGVTRRLTHPREWTGASAHRRIRRPRSSTNSTRRSVRVLAILKIKVRLADLGATALSLSPTDFGKLIPDETEKWGKMIRAANIKPE
jgi:hypothetical protein